MLQFGQPKKKIRFGSVWRDLDLFVKDAGGVIEPARPAVGIGKKELGRSQAGIFLEQVLQSADGRWAMTGMKVQFGAQQNRFGIVRIGRQRLIQGNGGLRSLVVLKIGAGELRLDGRSTWVSPVQALPGRQWIS